MSVREPLEAQIPARRVSCYEARYEDAGGTRVDGLYPARWQVLDHAGEHQVLTLDTVPSWLRGYYASAWVHRGDTVAFSIEGGQTGGSYALRMRGDSLFGTVRRVTDAGISWEPALRVVAWLMDCPRESRGGNRAPGER